MNKPVTGLAVGIGSAGMTPQVQDCVSDVFMWCGLVGPAAAHPQSWAILLIAAVAFLVHTLKGNPNAEA